MKRRGFRIEAIEARHLGGGSLRDILAAVVVPPKAWAKHVAKLSKLGAKKSAWCKRMEAALGHAVPAELGEMIDAEGPRGLPEPFDSGWMIAADVEIPVKGHAQKAFASQSRMLVTGLFPFGADASGDRVFASLRPHPLGVVEVFLYNHEVGELEDKEGESIADFVVGKWVDDDEYDPDDEYARPGSIGPKKYARVDASRRAFAARAKRALAKRPKHLAPVAMWQRADWVFGLLEGEPAFRFPEALARAPSLVAWNKEKATLQKEPELALYWMLHHLLFANDAACRQAAERARKCAGYVVPELAASFLDFLDGKKKTPLDAVKPAWIESGRALVRKNALAKHLAQRAREGEVGARASDLAGHDAALKKLARADATKRKLIARYFAERSREAYHALLGGPFPAWLLEHAAAAFRAGLAVDMGHPEAFAGLTCDLAASADEPVARSALLEALVKLAPNDDRLDYVLPALVHREEPDVLAGLRSAAWRWLELTSSIDKVLLKRQKRFTLDDAFARDDRLQPAVHAVLKRCDDEAEKLARAISEAQPSFRVLKDTAGYVYRVYGVRKMTDRAERLEAFLRLLDEVPGNDGDPSLERGVALDRTACVALAEASLALARLAPERARDVFGEMLKKKRLGSEREAGVAACLLPGVLLLDRTDRDGMVWLERVLGSRGAPPWLYGALLAARDARVVSAIPWLLPHAYTSQINSMVDDLAWLEAEARETLRALGSEPKPFDEDDEYASRVPASELGEALCLVGRYDKATVLRKIREAKLGALAAPAIGKFLEERFRFSQWEPRSALTDGLLRTAIELLGEAGAEGKREIERQRALPHLGDWAREMMSAR